MKKYIFLCLMKNNAGPAMVESIATSIMNNKKDIAYFMVPEKIENKERLDKISDRSDKIHFIYIDTGNKYLFIIKAIKLVLFGGRKIKAVIDENVFDLYMGIFPHPWFRIIGNLINTKHKITICNDPLPHSGERMLNKLMYEYSCGISDNLLVHTRSFIKLAEIRFNKKVYYMPHGLYSNYRINEKIAVESLTDRGKVTFLFFGRIEKYKGVDVLLKAFSKFNRGENVELIVAGKGDLTEYNELLLDQRITTINRYLNDEEINDLFSNRNAVAVLPYLDATQSGISLIAIGLDVPIIATDTGGLKEQMDDGNFGLFCEPGNVESLFDRMNEIYMNPELFEVERKKMRLFKPKIQWSNLLDTLVDNIQKSEQS